MSKINWLHISDLHFGSEKEIGDIKYIRDDLLDYVKNKFKADKDKFNYLFVTGDIFYGPNFYNNESQKKQSIKDATDFFDKLISYLKIDKSNVFVVPGNHDTNRKDGEKEKYINEITDNYTITESFDEEKIQTYQTEFNEFCAGLKEINYCEKAHKLISLDEIDILMLNTSISSCKSEKNTKLLLGSNLFKNELNRIGEDNWEDESRPLFILAHHSPDYFIDEDREFLRRELDDKKNSILYLCGHNHFAHENTIDNIHILFCGTNVKKEKIENNKYIYKKNEVSFLKGSFDTILGEATVYFYKWSMREWMENRDKRQDKFPHHAITFENNNPKTKLLKSKSESEAIGNFYDFLLNNLYEKSNKKQNNDDSYKYSYFKSKMESLVDIIEIKKPEWKFKDKYYRKFNTDPKPIEPNPLEQLVSIIREEYKKYREVKNRIIQQNHILTKIINDTENTEGFGILLYSKSMRVTDYLLSLDGDFKKKCIIYICAGNVRGNTQYKYKDGLDIAEGLFDSIPPDFHRFKDVKLIPDIYVDRVIKQGKIHAALFGAVALYYGAKSYTHFSNTVGSGLIVDLANSNNIPCIIIAEQSKAFNLYPEPICEKKFIEFSHPNKNLINNIKAEFEEFELIEFKNIKHIISDQEKKPWEDDDNSKKEYISKEAALLFLNKILKDRRKLSLSNDKKTITKIYLPEDKTIESDIISKLKNAGIAVPDIVNKKDDGVELKYYKGIRIFNFLVTLNSLKENEYRTDSSKKNQLDIIAQKLLSRCEEKQKQIQKELYEQFKNSKQISIYPQDKLTDIIELFFMCFKSKLEEKMNKQTILKEIDWVYEKFSINAIVPFRDASAKNMILVSDDLHLEQFQKNDAKRNAEVKKLFDNNKLQDIVALNEIIDIDFSSCINYTTPYDDVISFRFHERTAPYYPSYNLIWNSFGIQTKTEKESIVATFIIRFLRFGGRKLLYRVIDPAHHAIRFKYDDESYYFKKLPEIIEYYGITELPETIKLFKEIENIIEKILKEKQTFFIIPYDDENVMEIIKEIAKKETYSDVYPC